MLNKLGFTRRVLFINVELFRMFYCTFSNYYQLLINNISEDVINFTLFVEAITSFSLISVIDLLARSFTLLISFSHGL